jgi:1-acyl-sn-glycerol-3-phosphate acyltransferase
MSQLSDAPFLYRSLRRILPGILHRYLDLDVIGLENIPANTPAIITPNHLSFIDSIVMPLDIPRPVYFLGKVEYFRSWRTRWFFSAVGVVPTYRTGGDRSEDSLTAGRKLLDTGALLGIYPEGTRSPDGQLYKGKTGAARLALRAGVPIIPCGISGTRAVMPEGSRGLKRGHVTVTFDQPLDLSTYGDGDDPATLRDATTLIIQRIQALTGQNYQDRYASDVKNGRTTD